MNYIFKREDFILCDVPVPKGYPQSQTHAGIAFYNGKYYLTTSPYPSFKRSKWMVYLFVILRKLTFGKISLLYAGGDFENPCIYVGENNRSLSAPAVFSLLNDSPLMEKPKDLFGQGAYNSDPDIFVDNGLFYIINREYVRHSEPLESINNIYLIQGYPTGSSFVIERCERIFDYDIGKSPCITKYNNHYYLFSLETNSYNDGNPCSALYIRKGKDSLWDWEERSTIVLNKGNYEPWHMSVFCYKDRLYAVIACIEKGIKEKCWQMLGEFSEDLSQLKIYQTPLSDYVSYRGAALVNDEDEFVLYNTTVHEQIDGARSVDGRDIIMAHKPFTKLLSQLRSE